MIGVAIPFIDQQAYTEFCLDTLVKNAEEDIELILIDNGSKSPLTHLPRVWASHYIKNPQNRGVLESLRQALAVTNSPYLIHMHNDVLIHEKGWDRRIREAFESDPNLALMGFFGASGVGPDGARLECFSNMLGKNWGTPGSLHGNLLTGLKPSTVFDSLAMIWRVESLKIMDQHGIFDEIPPHHWYDRILTLRTIDEGYHTATIGIGFDHWGSLTYGTQFNDFAAKWCEENDIDWRPDPDMALYLYGKALFERDFAWRLPLWVDDDYNYRWKL